MTENLPHHTKVDGQLEVEHDPEQPYEVATKNYVDVGHQTSVEEGETGPVLGYRMGIRALFVYWSGFEENVAGHGYFQIQVATDAGFASIVDDVSTKANWTTFDGLTSGTTYYVRVRAVDAAGNVGAWSSSVNDPPDLATNSDINDVSFSKVTTGSLAVGQNAESTGYVAGSSGWQIKGNGDAEFNDVTVRGTVDMRNGSGDGILITDTDGQRIKFNHSSGTEFWELLSSSSQFKINNSARSGGDSLTIKNDRFEFTTLDDFTAGGALGPHGMFEFQMIDSNSSQVRTELGLVLVYNNNVQFSVDLNGRLEAGQIYDNGSRVSTVGHGHGGTSGPSSPGSTDSKPVMVTGGPSDGAGGATHSHEVPAHSHGHSNTHTHSISL